MCFLSKIVFFEGVFWFNFILIQFDCLLYDFRLCCYVLHTIGCLLLLLTKWKLAWSIHYNAPACLVGEKP